MEFHDILKIQLLEETSFLQIKLTWSFGSRGFRRQKPPRACRCPPWSSGRRRDASRPRTAPGWGHSRPSASPSSCDSPDQHWNKIKFWWAALESGVCVCVDKLCFSLVELQKRVVSDFVNFKSFRFYWSEKLKLQNIVISTHPGVYQNRVRSKDFIFYFTLHKTNM